MAHAVIIYETLFVYVSKWKESCDVTLIWDGHTVHCYPNWNNDNLFSIKKTIQLPSEK